MIVHVIEARYVKDYTVWLRFNDGTSGENRAFYCQHSENR